ncbi:hypothetical protein [Streptomyces lanatus]|uniref:Uncharacterized protein n=1 Tax=Streptomyces lanatus TaxID=66900 RepID=A0ABV1Y5L6_9ACTN|nr:hypothetical protein [Streptomyces lanatus]GHH25984.1 hypothetical protein GCM10018780_78540 [Streptomyces lanatus]
MSITQHHLLDTYRARQLGEAAPPAPGAHDWQVMREIRDHRQFSAVVAGRPAHGRIRRTLGRWLHLRPRSTW